MRDSLHKRFLQDESAAVGPMYALALFGLIIVAGAGWDYSRMMTMDSELQNAADQAALAAATQLDGSEGAMQRARDAANTYLATSTSEWVNETRLSTDAAGRPITSLTFNFYDGYDRASDTFGTEITDDDDGENATVVLVTVNPRATKFYLTAIGGLLSSGGIAANAVAGLDTAVCKVPPLMFCAPSANFPNIDIATGATDIGKGIQLHPRANEADPWASGNFGFLNIDYTDTPSGNPNTTLGWNSDFSGCAGEAVESRTGSRTPEVRALNTRFDLYGSGTPGCDGSGNFCPAENVRKNYVRVETQTFNQNQNPAGFACSTANSGTWTKVEDLPNSVPYQGMPADTSFSGNIGNGEWNPGTYMTNVYGDATLVDTVPDINGNGAISRYEVYQWEIANDLDSGPDLMAPRELFRQNTALNGNRTQVTLYCAYPQPTIGTAVTPGPAAKDRRIMTIAAVDCTGLNGHAQVDIIRWVDIFLVQPAQESGSDMSFLAEVKGVPEKPGGGAGFQYYGRNKPVLLR